MNAERRGASHGKACRGGQQGCEHTSRAPREGQLADIAESRAEAALHLQRLATPELASGAGDASPDPELTARLLQSFSEEAARLLLSDPECYPIERLVRHARWVLGQFG